MTGWVERMGGWEAIRTRWVLMSLLEQPSSTLAGSFDPSAATVHVGARAGICHRLARMVTLRHFVMRGPLRTASD